MIRDRIKNLRLTEDEEAAFSDLAAYVGAPLAVVIRALVLDAADRVLGPEGSVQTPEGRRIVADIDNTWRKA